MHTYKIYSDSSCDLGLELAGKYDIEIVPFQVTLDGKTYYRENIDISIDDFYKELRAEEAFPKTSLPSIDAYADAFRKSLDNGINVLCFCLTSKFSGSYQSACNAKLMLMEEYPEREIMVIDSYLAAATQGVFVTEAARMRDMGFTLSEVAAWCEETKQSGGFLITLDALNYLQTGGRLGKASPLAGGMLNIKPIIVLRDGELAPYAKARGRKKAISDTIDLLNSEIGDKKDKYQVFVMHADEQATATELRETLINKHGYQIDFPLFRVGTTIGAHLGPSAITIGYVLKAPDSK